MRLDFVADKILLEQLSLEEAQDEPLAALSDGPAPKGPVSHRAGGKKTFARSRRCLVCVPLRRTQSGTITH